jgi:signal transduction histidine kinase
MMNRIDLSYRRQKEFTGNASHELRTPIARIVMQLENISRDEKLPTDSRSSLKDVVEEVYYLSDVVTSLLLLSKINEAQGEQLFERVRLDEVVFDTSEQIKKLHPDLKLSFEIENNSSHETDLEVNGEMTLLQIAVMNLLKNAYTYSDDKHVQCLIRQEEKELRLFVRNHGPVPDLENTDILFNSFTRGSNTRQKPGSGLGLSIVRRIVNYHRASIEFRRPDEMTNELVITFPLST